MKKSRYPVSLPTVLSDEAEVWKRFQRGDKNALALIFTTYTPLLYHYGIKFFPDEQLVEDSIQDIFLEVWRKRASLSAVDSLKYYLVASLRRSLLEKRKAAQRLPVCFPADFPDYEETSEAAQQELSAQQEAALQRAVDRLPTRQKQAIRLKFLQGKSYTEITLIMGINYQTARKFIYKAVRNLRDNLSLRVPYD